MHKLHRHLSSTFALITCLVALGLTFPSSAPAQSLPAGWSDQDIGSPGQPGSALFNGNTGTWTVSGGGADIFGTSDQFNFASQTLAGDGAIVACVTSAQNTDASAKVGLMFRNSTAANAAFADLFVSPANGVWFQWRNADGASAGTSAQLAGITAPVWLKLVRSGSTFTGFYSINGLNWNQVGTTQSVTMAAAARVGLVVNAHNNSLLNTSTFGGVCVVAATNLPQAQLQRVNLAKYQAVTSDSAASGKPASSVTDGNVGNANAWQSSGAGPHWAAITLPLTLTLGSVHLYLGSDDISPVANFSLQFWNGSSWITVPGASFSGNTATVLTLAFSSPVTTTQVRLYSTDSTVTLRELALFGTNNPSGYPIGTDVTLNVAKKHPVTVSSTDNLHFGKGAANGYAGINSGWWQSANVNGPHTLDVDLLTTPRIASAHLYSGSASAPAVTNFTLQSWNGSAWVNIAGGTVTGNTQKERVVTFSSPVSTSKVRLSIPDSGAKVVRELAIFAASTGVTSYPIGTDVVTNDPPTTQWEDFADAFYQGLSQTNGAALTASTNGAGQATPAAGDVSQQFQVLYNFDSDTYRIRSRDTWLCLAAQNASLAPGTAAVECDYSAMPHQLWRLEPMGAGYYRIVNVWNALALQTDGLTPATVTLQPKSTDARQQWLLSCQAPYPKKGLADHKVDWAQAQVGWVWNWGINPSANYSAAVAYDPTAWSDAYVTALPPYYSTWHTDEKPLVLQGYNEPDISTGGGANVPVTTGVALWPQLEAMDLPLLSPAPANKDGGWLAEFYSRANTNGYRVDYTGLHIYGGLQPDSLISWLQSGYTQWGRPVWLTEFGIAYVTWSEETNYRFLAEFMWRAESLPWLRRYSIFPFYDGQDGNVPANPWDGEARSYLFYMDAAHTPTALGELYAAWDGDRSIRTNTAYLLHNKAAAFRIGNSGAAAPITGNIRVSNSTLQWSLAAATSGRFHLISLYDGKRLRWNGSSLDLAPAGTTGSAVEWSCTADSSDAYGYHFIDHSATGRRLRMDRSPASGAPTAITVSMDNVGAVSDNTRWRLVKPLAPATFAAPVGLTAAPGDGQVSLNWSAVGGVTSYNVKRSNTNGGPYSVIASPTATSYTDTGLTNGTTYFYVVSAVSGLESPNSAQASAIPSSAPAQTNYLWFLDTFTVTANQSDANYQYNASGRQSGFVAPLTYSQVPAPGSGYAFTHQVGHSANPGALLLTAGDFNSATQGRVSPDFNFKAAGTNRIILDVIPLATAWQGISLGANSAGRNLFMNAANAGFGVLFQPDGKFQAFDNGTQLATGRAFTSTPGTNHILIEVYDTDGHPWNGVGGTTLKVYADYSSAPFFSYTKGSGGYTNNYITLQGFGNYNNGFVDNFTFSADTTPAPAAPAGLVAVAGNASVTLTWNASSTATGYNVKSSLSGGGPYSVVATNITMTAYTNFGLNNGTTYYYVVSASNTFGESANSSQVSATPAPPPPPVISNITLSGTNLLVTGTNGVAGFFFYVLSSTNLTIPVSDWPPISTNLFAPGGGFTVTNPVDPSTPQSFFVLKLL